MLTGRYPCYAVYETADGRHVTVGALEPHFWRNLCTQLGMPECVEKQFAEGAERDAMMERFRATFREKTMAEWLSQLADLDICFGPVASVSEMLDDPQVRHRADGARDHGSAGRAPPHARQPDQAVGDSPTIRDAAARAGRAHRRGARRRSATLRSRSSTSGPAASSERGRRRAMAGILAVAAYVPRYRLPREVIAKEWGGTPAAGRDGGREPRRGQPDPGGQRRRGRCRSRRPRPTRSSSRPRRSPYAEKQGAATIAAVLDLPPTTRTLDVTVDAARRHVGDARRGRHGRRRRRRARPGGGGGLPAGEPESAAEQSFGDAAAALLVGAEPGLAEVVATHTLADEFLGTWRTQRRRTSRTASRARSRASSATRRLLAGAAKGVLAKAGAAASDLRLVILPAPNPRAPLAVAKALGLDPKKQLADALLDDRRRHRRRAAAGHARRRARAGEGGRADPGLRVRRRRRRDRAARHRRAAGGAARASRSRSR